MTKDIRLQVMLDAATMDGLSAAAERAGMAPSVWAREVLRAALLEIEMSRMDWEKATRTRKPSEAALTPYAAIARMRKREAEGKAELMAIVAATKEIPEWRQKAKICVAAAEMLTSTELAFVKKMKGLRGFEPTDRQSAWLDAIHAKVTKRSGRAKPAGARKTGARSNSSAPARVSGRLYDPAKDDGSAPF